VTEIQIPAYPAKLPITLVVMPEEYQSIPMTAPND
jgi:hypothetical protein